MDHVLSTYDRAISNYTAKEFARAGGRPWRCAAQLPAPQPLLLCAA